VAEVATPRGQRGSVSGDPLDVDIVRSLFDDGQPGSRGNRAASVRQDAP
jgi:hypothetical protein